MHSILAHRYWILSLAAASLLFTIAYIFYKKYTEIDTQIVAFYLSGPNESFSTDLARRWKKSRVHLIYLDDCATPAKESVDVCSQRLLSKKLQHKKFIGKTLVLIAGERYTPAVTALYQSARIAPALTAVILIRSQPPPRHRLQPVSNSPKLLVVVSIKDTPSMIQSAYAYTAFMREHGIWSWFSMLAPENATEVHLLPNSILNDMALYLASDGREGRYRDEYQAEYSWQNPLFNNDDYFRQKHLLQEFDVDPLLLRTLTTFYQQEPFQLKKWPLKKYYGLDLTQYRDTLEPEKRGRFVTFKNRKGHVFYLDLERYGRYQPIIVVGLDDETNLYRLAMFYRTQQFYSWMPQERPAENDFYVEPLGAFIHFTKPLPQQYQLPLLQYTTIIFDSIAYTNDNPYRHLSNLTLPTYRVLTSNCIPCHQVGDIGGRAHHLDARTGAARPGFALPLTTYSHEVLVNFFFNQQAVAKQIGVKPNFVEPTVAAELLEWLPRH